MPKKEEKKRGPLSAYVHQQIVEFVSQQKYKREKNKPAKILNKYEKGLFNKLDK